jgi:CRP-like cAMP-binding protein
VTAQLQQSTVRNQLLAGLAPNDFAALQPHLEPIQFDLRQVLSEPHQPIEHVYFPETGLASVTSNSGSSSIEIGIIGREGTTGTPIVLGTDRTPFRCFIQMSGHGHRLTTAAFQAALGGQLGLDRRLRLYTQALAVQISATAFTNVEHTLEMRLARWLLMCHDRVDGDDLQVTHEFLSIMLGVRRPGVTTTIHVLEGNGLIRATRGIITVRNRQGLEGLADNAYGLPEAEYSRLMTVG